MNDHKTTVTFLGTSGVYPSAGSDSASFVINGKYLVDTGYYAALKMKNYGIDPGDIEYLFITHVHPDHAIGLPQLLSERCAAKFFDPSVKPIHIIGPKKDLEPTVSMAYKFITYLNGHKVNTPPEEYYSLVPLNAGEDYETDDFSVQTCATPHNPYVSSLVYKWTDKHTGKTIVFTGDTGYNPDIVKLAKGVDLLIHDSASSNLERRGGHTSYIDAATTAKEADVGMCVLIHMGPHRAEQYAQKAQEVFPNLIAAIEGKTICL